MQNLTDVFKQKVAAYRDAGEGSASARAKAAKDTLQQEVRHIESLEDVKAFLEFMVMNK